MLKSIGKKNLITLIIAIAFLLTTSVAIANEPTAPTASDEKIISFNQTPDPNHLVTDPAKIKERRDNVKQEVIRIYNNTGDMEKVEEWLLKNGFVKVEPTAVELENTTGDVRILSSSSNVNMSVEVYYDRYTDEYSVYGNWAWINGAWVSDVPAFGGDVGGYDGLGLWFSNNTNLTMENGSAYLLMNDYFGYWDDTSSVWDWDANGVAIKYQDESWVSGTPYNYDYNFDSGFISVVLKANNPCTSYLKVTYGHDWKSTDLSSVSITSSGITFSFSSSSDRWQKTNNVYSYSFN